MRQLHSGDPHQPTRRRPLRPIFSVPLPMRRLMSGTLCALLLGSLFVTYNSPTGRNSNELPVQSLHDQAPPLSLAPQPADTNSPRLSNPTLPEKKTLDMATTIFEDDGKYVEVVADFALVRPRDSSAARLWLSQHRSQIDRESPSGFWRIRVPAGKSLQPFLRELRAVTHFDRVQPEGVMRAAGILDGETAYGHLQWNMNQIHWDDMLTHPDIELEDLRHVRVAVIDSGVAYEDYDDGTQAYIASPDLQNSTIRDPRDFVEQDDHANDWTGHGTHIANIICADGGTIGVAPWVELVPIRVLDDNNAGQELDLVDGILHAIDEGADVINLSLSFSDEYVPGEALGDAIQAAEDEDIVVVASSGNLGVDNVSYPAAYASVIAVGASRMTYWRRPWVADYSNTGSALDLIAPGGVGSLDVNHDGRPDAIVAQTITPGNPAELRYYLMAGTSQAAAHVSGAALWLKALGANAEETRQALVNSSVGTWGSFYFGAMNGIGVLDLPGAVDAYLYGNSDAPPHHYYANIVPLMVDLGSSISALGLIKVIDENGLSVPNLLLAGRWYGSSAGNFAVFTNDQGEAWLMAPDSVHDSEPALFGIQLDRIVDGWQSVAPTPAGFTYLSGGTMAAISAWSEREGLANAKLVFQVTPNAFGMPDWVAESFIAKPLGSVNAFAATALTFNGAYVPALSQNSASHQEVLVEFGENQEFGWGTQSFASAMLAEAVTTPSGEDHDILISPFDPAFFYGDLALTVPVINAPTSSFEQENAAFLDALSGDAVGYDGRTLLEQSGILTSFGDDGILTSFGDDGVITSFGDDGILTSFGDDGVITSFGDDGVITSFGDDFALQIAGASLDAPVMVSSSYWDENLAGGFLADMTETAFGSDYILRTPN